jgi:hypothetical protein
MDRDFTITPILINHHPLPQKTSWVKIFIYEPTEPHVIATRGKMYALLAVSSKSPVDFTPIMQLILEELQTHYFQVTDGGILATLELALDGIHKKLLLMGQQDQRLGAGFNFNLLTAVSWGTVLYLGRLGAFRAALLRNGKIQPIDDADTSTSNLYLASGMLQARDRVLLSTENLYNQFDVNDLQIALDQPVDSLQKHLESQLQNESIRHLQSAIVLDVDIKEVPSPIDEAIHIGDPSGSLAHQARRLTWPQRILGLVQKRPRSQSKPNRSRGLPVPSVPVLVAIVAAIGLAASIGWTTFRKTPEITATINAQPLINQIKSELQQAKDVAEVNPDRANELLQTTRHDVQTALKAQPNNPDIADLAAQVNDLDASLRNNTTLNKAIPIASFASAARNAKLVYFQQQISFIDQTNQLISVTSSGKTKVTNLGATYGTSPQLVATDTALTIIGNNQISTLNAQGQPSPPAAYTGIAVTSFATAFQQNLYVMDASVGQIYRLAGAKSSFADPIPYLQSPTDTKGLVDMSVDGGVYLLRQSGATEKYFAGIKQPLTLERTALIGTARAITTTMDSDNLYVLSATAILEWSKVGKYIRQYTLPDNAPIQAFAVDEPNKTLYILSNKQLLKAVYE